MLSQPGKVIYFKMRIEDDDDDDDDYYSFSGLNAIS